MAKNIRKPLDIRTTRSFLNFSKIIMPIVRVDGREVDVH